MPRRPPIPGQDWQLNVFPLVITNFKRPFYVNASNNGLGHIPFIQKPKPATLQHVTKQAKKEALSSTSVGTSVGGPSTSSIFKITS